MQIKQVNNLLQNIYIKVRFLDHKQGIYNKIFSPKCKEKKRQELEKYYVQQTKVDKPVLNTDSTYSCRLKANSKNCCSVKTLL